MQRTGNEMSIIYDLDENLVCKCNHIWDNHHQGVVMNPEYADYPLNIHGCIAQECEETQVNGEYFGKPEDYCDCNHFKPRARKVQELVDAWVKIHEETRKKDAGR